jgi:GNAT superfamily N-acetyltransferase
MAMAKVHIASWQETYAGLLPDAVLARLSIADEAIRWQRTLDRPGAWHGAVMVVADQNGSVVGYGLCSEQRNALLRARGFTGEISEVYLLRRVQRQGAGTDLMKAMAGALRERGHRAVSLWVLQQNGPARRFYEHLGGTLVAEKRGALPEVAYGWSDLRRLMSEVPG